MNSASPKTAVQAPTRSMTAWLLTSAWPSFCRRHATKPRASRRGVAATGSQADPRDGREPGECEARQTGSPAPEHVGEVVGAEVDAAEPDDERDHDAARDQRHAPARPADGARPRDRRGDPGDRVGAVARGVAL